MRKFTIAILFTLLLAACGVNDPLGVATPQIVDMYPAPGAAEIAVGTSVWATFDAAVDPAWVTASFTLTDALGVTTDVDVAYDATSYTVTITPSAPLAYGADYEAAFTAGLGAQSAVGTLAEDVAWTFSTQAPPMGGDTGGEGDGNTGGETGGEGNGDTGGETGDGAGGSAGAGAGGTGNTNVGDPVTDCDGSDCTYANVTLTGQTVPDHATWTLENVTIDGHFEIGEGATVHATNLVVNGHIEATGAAHVGFASSTVTDKVELKYGGTVHLTATAIGEHLELIGNYGSVDAATNDVRTYIQVDDNTGGVLLFDNAAGGDIHCSDNAPAPTGSGNVAGGTVSEQCLAL